MIQNPNQAPQRRGSQVGFGNVPAASSVTVVGGGANTTGLIVRTAVLYSTTTASIELWVNSVAVLLSLNNVVSYTGAGILVPPGQPLAVYASAAGASYVLTWDAI